MRRPNILEIPRIWWNLIPRRGRAAELSPTVRIIRGNSLYLSSPSDHSHTRTYIPVVVERSTALWDNSRVLWNIFRHSFYLSNAANASMQFENVSTSFSLFVSERVISFLIGFSFSYYDIRIPRFNNVFARYSSEWKRNVSNYL